MDKSDVFEIVFIVSGLIGCALLIAFGVTACLSLV